MHFRTQVLSELNDFGQRVSERISAFSEQLQALNQSINGFDNRLHKIEADYLDKMEFLKSNHADKGVSAAERDSGTRKSTMGLVAEQGLEGPRLPGSFETGKK